MLLGFGKPANDLLFNRIKALHRFNAESGVGLTIDHLSFDFEQPQSELGIVRDRFEAGPNLNRHLPNWKVTDAVSGRSARLGDYTATGVGPGSVTGSEACSAPLQAVR